MKRKFFRNFKNKSTPKLKQRECSVFKTYRSSKKDFNQPKSSC